MADGDFMSGIGQGLGKVLSYALPAALGAAMGGPLGAVAGIATEKGDEAQYQLQQGTKQMELMKLGLQAQQIQSNEELKKATLDATIQNRQQTGERLEQAHQDTEADRKASRDQQHEEYLGRMQSTKNEQDIMNAFRADQQSLRAWEIQLTQERDKEHEQDKKDEKTRQIEETRSQRMESAEVHASMQAATATQHRSHWTPVLMSHLGGRSATDLEKMNDEDYQNAVKDALYADSLKSLGYGRQYLLDHDVDKSIVDKAYPPLKAPDKPPGGGTSVSGLGKPPKNLWGKPGKPNTGSIGGKRVKIDEFGRVSPVG